MEYLCYPDIPEDYGEWYLSCLCKNQCHNDRLKSSHYAYKNFYRMISTYYTLRL